MSAEVTSKYFKKEEAAETLTGMYTENKDLRKNSYTYSTGAVYNGMWMGGLRHGDGTMSWTDGA